MPQKHLEHYLLTASATVDSNKVNMTEDGGSVNALVHRNTASHHTWSDTIIFDGKIDRETLQEIYAFDSQFDQTFAGSELTQYPNNINQQDKLYYQNIRITSLFSSRILLVVKNSSAHPGQEQLLRQACREIVDCYLLQHRTEKTHEQISQVYHLLSEFLSGKEISEEWTQPLLSSIGWHNSDCYQMIYLQSIGYQHSPQSMNYYASQLENYFSACLAIHKKNGIYLICNTDQEINPDFSQRLTLFARDNLFKTGASNLFSPFTKCHRYALQAENALSVGQKKNPSVWNYSFSNYLYEYILENSQASYPAEDFCPPSLRLLQEYDRNNPEVCLMETLYQYIRCGFNASIAAEKLFIHRTTFSYRMRKINTLAQIDLSNWKELFCIMMYFSMTGKQ